MKQTKIFQIVVIGIFVVFIFFGFLAFSGKLPLPTDKEEINYGEVTLWGSIPNITMQTLLANKLQNEKSISIKYSEIRAETFNKEFIEALADGRAPDLVILPQSELLTNLNKLSVVPYETIALRDFKDTFIEEAEMFLQSNGVVAVPFIIDPLVMYWNRDIFTSALITTPPIYWTAFYDLVPKITIRDRVGNITRSLVPFGEYRNVSNAKEILSLLLMQAGSSIVANDKDGALIAALVITAPIGVENPVITAMRFFTEFSKPEKDSYSWNRSLPSSRAMFESGDLALYFGFASEYQMIRKKNPHLNFDVAMVPQIGRNAKKITFGEISGLSIVKASTNQAGAFHAMSLLSSSDVISEISNLTGLPPVRRDLLSTRPVDPASSVFYDSALISRAWFDPSTADTNSIFMNMIDGVNTGRSNMNEAVGIAQDQLDSVLEKYKSK